MSDDVLKAINRFIDTIDWSTCINFIINNYKVIILAVLIVIFAKWLKDILLIIAVCFFVIVMNDKNLRERTIDIITKTINNRK